MKDFRRWVAISAIASQVFLAGNLVMWLVASGGLSRALDPSSFVTLGPQRIAVLEWSLTLDILAYLLMAPLAMYTGVAWTKRDPHASLYALGGVAYGVVGASGAAVLRSAWPPLITAYANAAGAENQVIQATFTALTEAVYRGLWNVVAVAGLGLWMIGTGALVPSTRPGLTALGRIAGSCALLDALFVLVGADRAAQVMLGLTGALAPVWIILVCIALLGSEDKTR